MQEIEHGISPRRLLSRRCVVAGRNKNAIANSPFQDAAVQGAAVNAALGARRG
jgi:hypothetical protein